MNNNMPHLKSPKKPKQKSRLGTASNEITGGGGLLTSFRTTKFSENTLNSIRVMERTRMMGADERTYERQADVHSKFSEDIT